MSEGLEGVIAARTILSHVDGQRGRLILRGRRLEDLAGQTDLEGIAALLWYGLGAGDPNPQTLRARFGRQRQSAFARLPGLLARVGPLQPMEALRFMVASLPDGDPCDDAPAQERVTAAIPVFLAGILRHATGEAPVAPDPALNQAADFLAMLGGKAASAAEIAALETYLVTVADHGLNASTFAARVIASTQAGTISAVTGALCALKGPLHGGAPGPVLDMFDAITESGDTKAWLEAAIDGGERLMGFGHRVYRVRDPRADVLKQVVVSLKDGDNRIAFAEAVEATALAVLAAKKPGRRLDTNVEFYTALALQALGIPRAAFTALFAMGRVVGWCAHIMEQERTGRLIRPSADYVGPEVSAA